MARTPRTLAERHQEAPAEGSKKKRSRAEFVVRGRINGGEVEELIRLRYKDDVTHFLSFIETYHKELEPTEVVIQIGKIWSQETFMNGQS